MIRPTETLQIFLPTVILGVAMVVSVFEFPQISSQLNLIALIATFWVLLWYAYDTHRIGNETVQQTELQTMPIMCLYIRYVDGIEIGTKREKIKQYAVTNQLDSGIVPSNYYLALRNMGNGAAFNVTLESNCFKVQKYQAQFFAPGKDEHAVKVVKKPNDKIRALTELNGEIFTIKSKSVLGKKYEYRYRIVDIDERAVEFLN